MAAANNAPNMKVVVGADTSQFDKGMRAAKAQVRDFSKVSSDALGKLGEAFGVNTAQIEKVTGAIGGLGQRMSQAGSEGTKAFGNLLSSVTKLNTGLVGLGLAGVVASFKALNAEAENFKSTVAGANIELQTQAYINTYRQVLHDTNSETGRAVAEWQANWQKGAARLGANIQHNFVTSLSGNGSFFQSAFPVLGTLFGGSRNRESAKEAAEGAADTAKEIFDLERQRKEQSVEISKLNAEIADLMSIAKDTSLSIAERQSAVEDIEGKLLVKRQKTVELERQLADLYQQMSDYAEDSVADADALLAQQQRVWDTDRAITLEENALLKIKNSLNSATHTQNAELQKQLELQQKIAQSRADLAALDFGVSGSLNTPGASAMNTPGLVMPAVEQFKDLFYAQLGNSLFLQVQLNLNKQSFVDMTQELQSLMANLASSVGDAIGGLVGDLVTGGDAFGNFKNAALSSFGDMATAVGKMAIATGVATLGIKAALESLNGWVAIAAGAALVALGAAVKAGLSNVAAGNYSASPAVASGSYSSGSNDYETRDIQVNVTGTLQADGDKLVAVLNNTNNRNGYTT